MEKCPICHKYFDSCPHSVKDIEEHKNKKEMTSDLNQKVEALEKRVKALENRLVGANLGYKYK